MLWILVLGICMTASAYILDYLRLNNKVKIDDLVLTLILDTGLVLSIIYFPLAGFNYWYIGSLVFGSILGGNLYNIFKSVKNG